jgi:glycosyltransferase involved in cell wall biosynthesis
MATFLHRHLRVPSGRLRVVHNGVELPAHGKQLNGVRTFATASTFAPCKATPLLVETFNALAADRTDLRLMMIGDGRDRRRCEELAARTQHGSQVEFTGFRSDIDTQLRRADVFVLPSLNENLPIALLRAMALGLPCIATDVGGIREVLTPDCGVIVPPGSVTELRAAMQRMLDEPGLAARLGMAARQRVVECFSQAQCADGHLRIWSDVLRETRC